MVERLTEAQLRKLANKVRISFERLERGLRGVFTKIQK